MTVRILPVPLSRPIEKRTLPSGGVLILEAGFHLLGHSKPQPRGAEDGSEGDDGLPDGFVDEDSDGNVL